jgi:hypothetical protein
MGLEPERRRPDDAPQGVHVIVERGPRSRWSVVTPELVDQLVGRHRLVRPQEQVAEERSLSRRRDVD